ncbi:MAG TPA: helix-turn-helix transcriptional regulator [Acidimicrobiales bacterium]|nr:helix-turn-helix transcriptional regulator [Acidimicrobiales bacterium]
MDDPHSTDGLGAASPSYHDYVEACLLLVLVERPAYGYELKEQLDGLGLPGFDRGRIYRVLRGLEAVGAVVSHWETAQRGPARRTYELTDAGHDRLRAHVHAVRGQRRRLTRFLTRFERLVLTAEEAVA